jgi:hypothetical protein
MMGDYLASTGFVQAAPVLQSLAFNQQDRPKGRKKDLHAIQEARQNASGLRD